MNTLLRIQEVCALEISSDRKSIIRKMRHKTQSIWQALEAFPYANVNSSLMVEVKTILNFTCRFLRL
jgi:hypothetical protein